MCNESFRRRLQLHAGADLPGDFDLLGFVSPAEPPSLVDRIRNSREGESPEFEIQRQLEGNGESAWYKVRIYPVVNQERADGYCVTLTDITDRKKNELALSYSASLLNHMKAAVVSTDTNFLVISANPAAERLSQMPFAEVKGRRILDVLKLTFVDCDRDGIVEEIAKNDHWEGEIIFDRKDGRRLFFSSTVSAVRNPSGTVVGYLSVHNDITEKKEMEVRLNLHDTYINSIFDATAEALHLVDLESRVIIFNQRGKELMRRMTGLKMEEGQNLFEVLPAFRQKVVMDHMQMAKTGANVDYEVQYPGGLWLWICMTPVRDSAGVVTQICVSMKDISAIKSLEFQLRKKEAEMRSLFNSMAEGVVYQSLDGTTVTCNESAEQILRVKAKTLEDRKFPLPDWDMVDKDRQALDFAQCLVKHANDSRSVKNQVIGIRREKGVQWLSLNREPVYDSQHEIKGCLFTFSDITRKRKMYRELKLLMMAANRVNNSVVVTDPDRRVVWVNRAFTHNTGYTLEEAKGRVPGHVLQGAGTNPATVKYMREALNNNRPFETEVKNYRKNGEEIWLHIRVQPLFSREGTLDGYLGVAFNVTEQKKLQETLIQQEVEAQKKVIRATIAGQEKERNELGRELHDNINQLLAATKIQLETHLKSPNGRPDCVRTGYDYITTVIREIRVLSKRLVSPRFREDSLADEIGLVLSNLGLLTRAKVRLEQFDEQRLPVDLRLSLFRIIQEQLSNIHKYADATAIQIEGATDDRELWLNITDDGNGFEATQRRAGIGLNNIQTRAELYNGKVEIISAPGKGCRLSVRIPIGSDRVND